MTRKTDFDPKVAAEREKEGQPYIYHVWGDPLVDRGCVLLDGSCDCKINQGDKCKRYNK